jgi:L-glyceraldehyde 3-phosphate reductase
MTYLANESRYESMPYRRVGRSGLKLPAISLGLWQNFGDDKPLATQRAILRRAFDLGITHFDLANNYGPPPGSAETNFGQLYREDFSAHRDELVLSTKAGYDMWPGPYGNFGSRKYLLSSLDQSLSRMGVDYVDIFYSHRADPDTPLEETMGALHTAVTSGRALYAGISSYSPARTREAAAILADLGTPLLITSLPTRCSIAGSRTTCSIRSTTSASAVSRSRRWPRGCSPTATSVVFRRTPGSPGMARRTSPW